MKLSRLHFLAALTFAGMLPASQVPACNAAEFPSEQLGPFLKSYCLDCHSGDKPEAGLNLEKLPTDLASPVHLHSWAKVYDKVRAGEMPPAKSDQPTQEKARSAMGALHLALRDSSLQRQKSTGRVVLRRLNRIEYENTLNDLLGLGNRWRDQLPEDRSSDGFDNVAEGLDISPSHMIRYLEVADQALEIAHKRRPNDAIKKHVTAAEQAKRSDLTKSDGKDLLIEGDAVTVFTRRPGHSNLGIPAVKLPGIYRLRFSASAVNVEKPMALEIVHKPYTHFLPNWTATWFDIHPGKPRVYEFAQFLDKSESFGFDYARLPTEEQFKKTKGDAALKDIKAPGVRIEWYEIEGPLGESWPPKSHTALFGDLPMLTPEGHKATGYVRNARTLADLNKLRSDVFKKIVSDTAPFQAWSHDPKNDAERLLRTFASRAFRRPATDADVAPLLDLVIKRLDAGYSFHEAMRVGFKSVLCSPQFLYFQEPAGKLDDYAVASRLSYFFWSGPPDEELFKLAESNELTKPAVLKAQVERMLKDPRAAAFTEHFTGQWLDLRNLKATSPEPQLYQEFDDELMWALSEEPRLFFNEVLQKNLPLLAFIDSDFLFVNQRLADHYGIPGVEGSEFRKAAKPADSPRGGVLTLAAVLKVTANGTTTSPVLRGKFVLDRVLGTPPSPPPPGTPGIEPDIRGATTIRQLLDKHRNIAQCAACHKHIDPPGFALESFDAIGGFRTFYRTVNAPGKKFVPIYNNKRAYVGPNVELGDVTPEGDRFENVQEYKQLLLKRKDQIARCLAEKLLTYSTGAGIQYADREVVDQIVANVAKENYGFRTLIHEIVQSRVFLSK